MKLFSIALSFTILFQSLGITLNDIVQIDDFIEHAKFHSKEYGDNVFVFISKHYGDLKTSHQKQHQEEQEDHKKLPFQNCSHLVSIIVLHLGTGLTELKSTIFSEVKKHHFFYRSPSSSPHLEGLLQPPRFL